MMADLGQWMTRSKELLAQMSQLQGDPDQFGACLCRYIQCRFMLERCPALSESLADLAEESVSIMTRIPSAQLHAMEDVSGCRGAKSAVVKRILLIMSLNNGLGWHIVPQESDSLICVEDFLRFLPDAQ